MNSYILRKVLIETIVAFSDIKDIAHSVTGSEIESLVPEQSNDFQKITLSLVN